MTHKAKYWKSYIAGDWQGNQFLGEANIWTRSHGVTIREKAGGSFTIASGNNFVLTGDLARQSPSYPHIGPTHYNTQREKGDFEWVG